MESSGAPNQGYWFVLREDQGNVIFSSNSIQTVVPEPQISESRYIVDSSTGRLLTDTTQTPVEPSHDPEWEEPTKAKDFWDGTKIKLLLTLCLENKGETQWEDIGSIVGASADECSTKYRHLRRTYLRLLRKKRQGKDIKWGHYTVCDEVFTSMGAVPAAALEPWDEPRVHALLTHYLEYLPRFRNPSTLQKDLWKDIAARLGTSPYNAYHKFKNMKRSYFNWLSKPQRKGTKWPYHQYFERIYQNHNPNNKPWERNKIKVLLDAYANIAYKFRNPKLQKKELWKEISKKVGETPSNCDRKYRNLKQTYMKLKPRVDAGRTTKWRYYKDFDLIYANATRYIDMDKSKIVYRNPDSDYVTQLLTFYIENKSKFRDPLTKNKTVWRKIAPRLGLSAEECDKKFRNLKQTYIRLAWKKKQTGECVKWPYFGYFERIFKGELEEPLECSDDETVDELRRLATAGVQSRTRFERDRQFQCLAAAAEESNRLQRERNTILQAMLDRRK